MGSSAQPLPLSDAETLAYMAEWAYDMTLKGGGLYYGSRYI